LEVDVLGEDEVGGGRGGRDQGPFRVFALLLGARQLHRAASSGSVFGGAAPASQTIASASSSSPAAARAAARSANSPTAVGPEPLRIACGAPAARRRSSAAPISGRMSRAAGSRSLTSSSL